MRAVAFAVCGLFLSGIGLFAAYTGFVGRSVEAQAAAIVERCKDAPYRPTCYETEVPSLLSDGMHFEDAFEVAYAIQELDATGEYCHGIGHRLGAVETAKDPSKWKEVARRTPLGECLNGGMHGAFQERFKSEWLTAEELPAFIDEMRGFCNPTDTASPGDLNMCAHGLGHLFLFVTNGEIDRALSLCPAMAFMDGGGVTRDAQELSCYDGLFMQLFEPHEPEDHALIEGKVQTTHTVEAFCAPLSGLAKAACITRSAGLFFADLGDVKSGIPKPLDCNLLESERRRDSCAAAQLRLFARDTFFDMAAADDYCATFPPARRGWCYASAGSFALMSGYQYDKPFLYCEHADAIGAGDACRAELSRLIGAQFRESDPIRGTLCGKLPEPHASSCREGQTK